MQSFEELKEVVRRHPHVFGDTKINGTSEVMENWEEIKKKEKEGKEDVRRYLSKAFNESEEFIDAARKRKGFGN